jgi:tyrosine-protein kinase Etk/Wzc
MDRLSFADYARVIWRARYVIVGMVAAATIVATFIGNMQTKVYSATSTMLAPRDSQASGMSGTLGSLLASAGGRDGGGLSFPGFQVAMPGLASNLDVFNTLLMSRTMREEVMGHFAKDHGAGVARKVRDIGTSFTKDRTTLSVTVRATEPDLAAAIANAYFDILDRRLQRTAENQAKRQEVFYRAQLERAAKEVDHAEDALVKFQRDNRMVPLDANTKATAESGANLRGQIMTLELQRELFRMRYTEQHPQMRELEKQISELKKQYSQNLFGQAMDLPPDSPGGKGRKEYFVSTERMTPTQFAYLKLFRNLKIQEAFYTGALQGLENMRYATEAGRPQGIEILDPAVPPTNHVSPNLPLITFAAAVGSLVVGMVGALVRETVVQMSAAPRPALTAPRPGRVRPRPAVANGTASDATVSAVTKSEPVA